MQTSEPEDRPDSEYKIPAIRFKKWREWSESVLEYLMDGPKAWYQLEIYGRRDKMPMELLRNCLAWLSVEGRVVTEHDEQTGKAVWRRK